MGRSALVALTLLALAGCESNTADARVRKFFRIDQATPLTEPAIRASALRLVPPGSDADQTRRAITGLGIGMDGLSAYYPPGDDGKAHVLIRLDPRTFGTVKREYSLALQFGPEHRLQDIQVQTWLTGP